MPSWWGKSSSKEAKKKRTKESFIDTLHRSGESKSSSRSGGTRRSSSDTVSERGSQSRAESRSTSPSKHVARCQSFSERPQAQPLPLPGRGPANVSRTDSGVSESAKPKVERVSKSSLFLPLPRPACIRHRLDPTDLDVELAVASISSECPIESDNPCESGQRSPLANDYDIGCRIAGGSPSRRVNFKVMQISHGAFCSAPDSSMSSPARSPIRPFGYDQVTSSAFISGKLYPDLPFLGSGQCSSHGSCQTSGHNSMGGDLLGQLFRSPVEEAQNIHQIPVLE